MSSLGEFLNAMVELRAQKARVAEYNANQQIAGMSELGQGIGGFLGNLGKGLPTQQDLTTNRLVNEASPPRAVPVNPALASAAPTIRPGQIPYSDIPITPRAFTGGKEGLAALNTLDKSDMARERLANQQQLNEARIGNYASLAEARGSSADVARQRLEETIKHHGELMAARGDAEKDKLAMDAMRQTNTKYQDDVKIASAHNLGMGRALASAAGAKTQADWEKAVALVTSLYQAGTKQGFKDLPYPEIPPSPDQKAAAATAVSDAAGQDTWHWYNPGSWGNPSPEAIAAQQKTAQEGVYQYGGPAEYEMAPLPPTPSNNPQDYYPQGPSQAAQQGPAPSAAAPAGGGAIPTISLQEARKKNPNITPGLKTDKHGNQILVQ